MKFTQPVSMKVDEDQFKILSTKLKELGYKWRYHNPEEYGIKNADTYLVTNVDYCDNTYYLLGEELSLMMARHRIENYNEELFLALASMTDEQYGIKDEWWIFKNKVEQGDFTPNKLYQARHSVNKLDAFLNDKGVSNGFSSVPLKYLRKATKEELIAHFTNQPVIVQEPPVEPVMKTLEQFTYKECIHCKTQEEYDTIVDKLIALGKLFDDFKIHWKEYKENTILYPFNISYSSLKFAEDNNKTIYKATDFIGEQIMKNKNEMPALKSGQIVEQDNGKRGLVVDTNGRLAVYWADQAEPHPFKTISAVNNTIGIVIERVYNTPKNNGLSSQIYNKLDNHLIWKKPDPNVVLTLQEIADKFGVDIKNLSILEYEE